MKTTLHIRTPVLIGSECRCRYVASMEPQNRTEEERRPLGTQEEAGLQQQLNSADTRYPRSVEGILRIISVPVAVTGMVLAVFGEYVGIFYIFVGIGFLIYVGLVFIVEMFVPGIYIHRLLDSFVCLFYSTLWLIAAILATIYGTQWDMSALKGAAFMGYVLVLICAASAFLAFRTWSKSKQGII